MATILTATSGNAIAVPVPAQLPKARIARTVIVGTGVLAVRLARALRLDQGRTIVGAVDVTRLPHLESEMPDVAWLGSVNMLSTVVVEWGIDEICVALPIRSCVDHWVRIQAVGRELGLPVSFNLDVL